MVRYKNLPSFGSPDNDTLWARRGNSAENAGFVLIFTLWIIIVATATIGLYLRNAPDAPKVIEQHLGYPLELQQLYSVVHYATTRMGDAQLVVDERWKNITRLEELESKTELYSEENKDIRVLRETLEQLGFDVKIGKDEEKQQDIAELKQKLATAEAAQYDKSSFSRQYTPQPSAYTLSAGDKIYEVLVTPANTLPNLNLLEEEELMRYLASLGFSTSRARELAHLIIDWRDTDNTPETSGAESSYYASQGIGYRPKNAPIERWDELYFLKGVDAELISFLRQNFTLSSNTNKLALQYVSPDTLAAIAGVSLATAQNALDYLQIGSDDAESKLFTRIGLENASKILEVVQNSVDNQAPVAFKVAGNRLSLQGVYNVEDLLVLELFAD